MEHCYLCVAEKNISGEVLEDSSTQKLYRFVSHMIQLALVSVFASALEERDDLVMSPLLDEGECKLGERRNDEK